MTEDITQSMLNECVIGAYGEYCQRIARAGKNASTKAAEYAAAKLPISTGAFHKALAYAKPMSHDKQLQTGLATLLKAGKARCVRVSEPHAETPTAHFHYRFEKV